MEKAVMTHPILSSLRLFIPLLMLLGAGQTTAGINIQHWQTGNGTKVYFAPSQALPIVDVRIVFDAGSARDGNLPGLAKLTANLIDDGTGDLNADQLAGTFEALGARFGVESLKDMATISLRSLSDDAHRQRAIETLAELLEQPAFPSAALAREKKLQLTALRAEEESPSAMAERSFMSSLYIDHPYGGNTLGTRDSLEAITRDDITGFYKRYYVANNAIIVIVGKTDRDGAVSMATILSKGLNPGRHAAPIATPKGIPSSKTIHSDFPSSQTHILIGQPGIRRGDPDYFPLYVGNHILGGSGLVSRISEEVREQRGLAYSAYSYFSPMRAAGPFTMGLQTRNEKATEAHGLMIDILRRFVNEGPRPDELIASQKNITGGFPLRISSNRKIAGYLAMIGFYDLPLDYLDTFSDRVRAVTVAQIKDAFLRRIHPERLVTTTVGGKVE